MHTAVTITTLSIGFAMLVIGIMRMRAKFDQAERLVREGPSGHAVSRLRTRALRARLDPWPSDDPPLRALQYAHDSRAREAWKAVRPGVAQSLEAAASAREGADASERSLRRSLAGELLHDLRWDAIAAVFGFLLLVAGALDAVA
jgi:hypothetical protein